MFSRSSWLHLRIPFSYFLCPIYLFALSISSNLNLSRLVWTFIIIHIFLYPASNGFNSYFDKDEGSIGGIKNPPPVSKDLYWLSLIFDAIAIVLGVIFVNTTFAVLLVVYGLVSKAYSHPAVRLKKYPFVGWLTAGIFQGLFTVVMCYVGINNFPLDIAMNSKVLLAGSLASLMLMANYPMTQIYQHDEDSKRGDRTISLLLGIRGTFLFVGGVFFVVTIGFFWFLSIYFNSDYAWLFVAALFPVVAYFFVWMLKCYKSPEYANYTRTMWLNFISSTCLIVYFVYLFLNSSRILDAL